MKNLLLGLVLSIAAASPAHADKAMEYCESINKVAGSIMGARQSGVSLAEAVALTDSEILRGIVMDAYKRPRFHHDDFIKREITDFQDKWFMVCLQGVKA